jgi:hypothetical protein
MHKYRNNRQIGDLKLLAKGVWSEPLSLIDSPYLCDTIKPHTCRISMKSAVIARLLFRLIIHNRGNHFFGCSFTVQTRHTTRSC